MKKNITTLITILLITNLALAQGVDRVITVSDKTPANDPCLPDDMYAKFKTAIANFLGSDALKDIEKQIRDHAGGKAVAPIEIHLDDLDGFKKQFVEDTKKLKPPGTEEEAENIYYSHAAAYTYLTDTRENGVRVIKIKIFCNNGLRVKLTNNTESGGWRFYELLIHEFVHAKRYAMLALGVAEAKLPFRDHDDNDDNDEEEDFFKEVKRLLEKLIKELKDKGLVSISPVQQAEEMSIADLGIAEPRLLPTSPLYFLKEIGRGLRQFLTFNPVAKARLELNVANQKAAEVKKIQEINPANTNAIKKALERYQTSQARLKSKLEILKETSQNPNVDRLIEQLTVRAVTHAKLFDGIARRFDDRADLKELTRKTKQKIEESAAAAAQKDDPAKFATRLEQALIQSKGSDLKHLRSVEIIERIQDKAAGDWRESLEELRQEFTVKLGEDIKKKLEKEGEAAVRSGIEQLPGDTARFSIILKEVEAGLKGREKEVVGRVAEVLEKITLEEKDIAPRAEEQIKRAEAVINELEEKSAGIAVTDSDAPPERTGVGVGKPAEIAISGKDVQRVKNLLAQAQNHLIKAKQGFAEGKYGEAFGQARAAQVIARNGLRLLGSVVEKDLPPLPVVPSFSPCDELRRSLAELDELLKAGKISERDYRLKYESIKKELAVCEQQVSPAPAPTYPAVPKPVPQPSEITKPTEGLVCTQEWNPVCGEDGKTYSNECMARVAGVGVKHKGECAIKPPVIESPSMVEPPKIEPRVKPIPIFPQLPIEQPPPALTPSLYEFKLEADDFGFYPDSTIAVPKGSRAKIHFIVRTTNVYFGGLDFRSSKFRTETVKPGGTAIVEFIADESFAFTSYWPASGVQKATGRVVAQ